MFKAQPNVLTYALRLMYFFIENSKDYKKHLLQLKNIKSTFKKSASTSGLMRGNGLDRF